MFRVQGVELRAWGLVYLGIRVWDEDLGIRFTIYSRSVVSLGFGIQGLGSRAPFR